MTIGVDIRGIPEVRSALGKMEGPLMKRTLQKAATAGAKTLKPFVQAEAPKGKTGRLRKSVSSRQARRERPAAVVSARPKVAFYRHMVIGGTKPHQIRFPNQKAAGVPKSQGNISHPGAKPNPFVSRGFDRGQSAAMAAVEKVVGDYLDSL
jgi:hypothetical protein